MLDNKNTQKIFSLSDFRKKQLLGEISERTRETYREYGYFGGSALSIIERIDYSNDTSNANIRGNLLVSQILRSACGNSNFGYFLGGTGTGSNRTIVQRIDYSNDSANSSTRGPLVAGRRYTASTGNSNFGYNGGGDLSTTPIVSTVDRIDYNNDLSTSLLRGPLSLARISSNRKL